MTPHAPFPDQPAYSESAQALLGRAPAHFIDNGWVASSHERTIPVEDPSTGRRISTIADASDADVDRAVAAARRAFDDGTWTRMRPLDRSRLIDRLADLIERDRALFAELDSIDNGKPLAASGGYDVPQSIDTLRYASGWATRLSGEHLEPAGFPAGSIHAYVRREPVGVCAQIVPWNFPLMMAVQKLAPALAAGCTLVLKPAEQTPLSALRLGDLVHEAGFPPGVVNIVTGMGETAGDRLVRHPQVDKVAFTGSTEVGKIISRTAADTLKRVTLELGGKSPVIVLPDADFDRAAVGAAMSVFGNSGQSCIAGSRLFVHASIFDDFLGAVAEAAARWTVGPSLAPGTMMGPLVSEEQRRRVLSYVESGRADGASLLLGGEAPAAPGYYVPPTILADVRSDMRCVREEIFGPVLAATRFDDLDEAVKAANDTSYGLAATIWTRDVSAMHQVAGRLRAGMVWGNVSAAPDVALPFGGYKQSGQGRESGWAGVEAYTELKTVAIAL